MPPPRTSAHDELLSEVAHRLRTPLGVITGYVELLRLRDDPGLRADALPRIEEAADRLSQTIDRLVTVLESESGDVVQRFVELPELHAVPWPRSATATLGPDKGPRGVEPTRVVVVDDDDDIRELLLRTLPLDGVEILEARDGNEALSVIEREAPDLVVLDWDMPNASGGDVLAELARRELKVPVIVLRADDEPGRRQMADANGAQAFLAKPFSPLELLREIERLLG
jgi:CheY-like chemotaxis protein